MREEALNWWDQLSFNDVTDYYDLWLYDPTNNRDWSFSMVCASRSTIEFIYRKFYLEENM